MGKERANTMSQNAIEIKNFKMRANKLDVKLINASMRGRTWRIRQLLMEGADVNGKNERGRTGLMYATYNGHIGTVKLFVKNENLEINIEDENGRNALRFAKWNGYSEIAGILEVYGAK